MLLYRNQLFEEKLTKLNENRLNANKEIKLQKHLSIAQCRVSFKVYMEWGKPYYLLFIFFRQVQEGCVGECVPMVQ